MSASAAERRMSRTEVIETLELDERLLIELERERVVTTDGEGFYSSWQVEQLRVCHTLRRELGVNVAGVDVILHLLERIYGERRQFYEVLERLRQLE